MTPEAKVKKAIKTMLHKYKIYYIMPRPGIFGAPVGTADFICCICGFFMAIEAKSAGGHERGVQGTRRKEVTDAGGMAFIVTPDRLPALEQTIKTIIRKSMEAMQQAMQPNENIPATENNTHAGPSGEETIDAERQENAERSARALGMRS